MEPSKNNELFNFVTFIGTCVRSQQDGVISEIQQFGAPHSKCVQTTLQYLKTLNNMLERGVLCKEHITSSSQSVFERMTDGFDLFCKWREDVIRQGDYMCRHTCS